MHISARSLSPLLSSAVMSTFAGEIGDNADNIRRDFLELIRTESESFDLCEFYAFWCIAGNKRKISLRKENKERMMQLMPRVFNSLTNRDGFACFDPPPASGNNASSITANALCQTVFGIDCLWVVLRASCMLWFTARSRPCLRWLLVFLRHFTSSISSCYFVNVYRVRNESQSLLMINESKHVKWPGVWCSTWFLNFQTLHLANAGKYTVTSFLFVLSVDRWHKIASFPKDPWTRKLRHCWSWRMLTHSRSGSWWWQLPLSHELWT